MVGYVDDMMRELEYRKQQDAIKNREYLIDYLNSARTALIASAQKFGEVAIKDSVLRQLYTKNIKRISDQVLAEVNAGKMYARDGAKFCNEIRNKIMLETRRFLSPIGLQMSEKLKKDPKTYADILDKNSNSLFKKPFIQLNRQQKNKVFYATISSSGRDNRKVTVQSKQLAIAGSIAILVTAILAVWAICEADDKIRESINQASIITGGSLGGSFAGALGRAAGLGAYCGPYAVPCIAGIVIIGTIIGGILADMVSDTFEEEVAEFIRWELL